MTTANPLRKPESLPQGERRDASPAKEPAIEPGHVDHTRIPIVQLVWPMLVENMLRISLLSVDTFMLSRYSPKAVAAMSLVTQFGFFILLIYTMIAVGASILISQNLGAGKRRDAGFVGVASLALMGGVSFLLSALAFVFTPALVGLYHLEPEVAVYARQFLTIYGGLSFFLAFNVGQASILRAWGHPRDSMYVNIGALVLTIAGNALSLFGFFGFPVLGMIGVAGSTVLSQVVACIVYYFVIRRRRSIQVPLGELARVPASTFRSVLAVGIPTAGENLSHNLAQIAILALVAQLGTSALAAAGILLAILRYVFMPGISIGNGTQVKVSYLVGAGKYAEAKAKVYRYFAVGFLISLCLALLVGGLRRPIVALFSQDPELLALAPAVLLVSIFYEPGRSLNTIIIPALKGAGDVRFPVYVGIASMWGIGVLGAWVLGIQLHLGLVGVWIAMAADEWLRGSVMFLRWRSGVWKSKTLVRAT